MKPKGNVLKYVPGFIIFLLFISPFPLHSAEMADYCLIPPYVMRGGVPPNLVIAYEKGSAIINRAYSTTYNAATSYYGFFDSASTYRYCNPTSGASPCASSGNFFEKASCTPSSAAATNCFSGNVLNWALMSSLDLSRKAIIGFGEPATGAGTSAGEVFTYTGTLYSKGQAATATISAVGYTFCLDGASGSNPTGLKIRLGEGQANCNSATLVIGATGGGNFREVSMRFTDEYRLGLIQRIGDANQDLRFDVAGPRFAVKRWNSGNDKQEDVMRDSPSLTAAEQQSYFKSLLTAISKAPPNDPQDPKLANMMIEISKYFRGVSSAYDDNDAFSQTPYSWANDPLRACRKSFVLYLRQELISAMPQCRLFRLPAVH